MTTTFIDVSRDRDVESDAKRPESADGWAARLVAADASVPPTELIGRACSGLGLAALYGLAIGARQGGASLIHHAVGVPFGLLLVMLLGTPSMFVFLSLCKAPMAARSLASTAARGTASAGLLLAGLAPAALLFVVSSETPHAARGAVAFGLFLAGGVSLSRTTLSIIRETAGGREAGGREAAAGTIGSLGGAIVAVGFAGFAVVLAMRVWSAVLPILHATGAGGAS
jgi:hypothetical protein